MEYHIEKYRAELKDQIVEFQKLLWSPDEASNRSYFEWKYERNPHDRLPNIYLALLGDKVVGMRGLVGARWKLGSPEKTAFVPCAADLVIHPDHRSLSLLMRINQAAFDDLAKTGREYVFNMSANHVNFIASLAEGWRRTTPVDVLIRPPVRKSPMGRIRAQTERSQFVRRLTESPFLRSKWEPEPFQLLDRDGEEHCHRISAKISLSKRPRPAEMADLVTRLDRPGRIQLVRDPEFFAWRFDHPLSEHRFFFWDEMGLQGYLVLGQALAHAQGHSHVSIFDWEASDDRVCAGLLDAALPAGQFSPLQIWSATLPAEIKAILYHRGFKLQQFQGNLGEHNKCILVRAVRSEMCKSDWCIGGIPLLDLANWDIRSLYSV